MYSWFLAENLLCPKEYKENLLPLLLLLRARLEETGKDFQMQIGLKSQGFDTPFGCCISSASITSLRKLMQFA